ncbi:hypothetical protein MMC34_004758 [Xylographa carneopallida]|nr:hypothetical protein [Xylographa carneopallida]
MAGSATSKSRVGVTLQGYDQVIALSQANINESLEYHFKIINPELCRFELSVDAITVDMIGTIEPPTVQLIDQENADQALYCLRLASGTFTFWPRLEKKQAPQKVEIPLKGWKIAFYVDFDLKKMAQVSQKIKDQVQLPGSYSEEQLIIVFGNPGLINYSWENSLFPGVPSNLVPLVEANVRQLIDAYIIEKLKGPGDHNVIGYAVKVDSP